MTSNIGAKKLQTSNVGWTSNETTQTLADFFENEARKFFRPEIFNRLDQIIPFASLDRAVIRKVVEREVAQLRQREGIQGRNLEWKFSEEVYDYLGELGYKPKYGARALQRALQEEVIIPLSKQLNEYPFLEKLVVEISMKNDRLHVEVEADPLKMDLMLEELTQHEFMDYASGLRQAIYRLLEGNAYTQFAGNLRELRHDQLRRPKIFWANADNPRQLAYYTNIDERVQTAKHEMDATETDMALITMGLRPLNTLFYDKIKAWDTSYFELKVELLALIRPELNSIQIGIYGKKSPEIFKIYVQMLEAKNYAWEAQTVWYRESLYNKLIEPTENTAESEETYDENESDSNVYMLPSEHPEKAKTAQKSKQYYKKPFLVPNPNDKDKDKINNYKIDEKGDVFMGLELMIMGFGVAYYFADEGGQQRIAGETEKSNYEKIFVALNQAGEMFKTPDEIHRQNCSVWQMRSRRTFHQEAFEDMTYKIPKRRLAKGTEVELLLELMNKRFSKRIDEELGS
jgi:ATP-dependent Clp protease ATP-binding subunit ClpA